MSKINQMEKALQEIDATKFHKLIDSYLSKSYSYKITSNGTKLAEDKPTKGTPDSFAVLENGKYIFIEYTTQKTNIKNKFLDDIGKCFDEEKTGIKVTEIEKIILACNSDLNPKEIKNLKDECKKRNIDCTILGNSIISNELFSRYPNIAKEFLGISVDSGQILDYDDFIKNYNSNNYSTSLNTSLLCREEEFEKLYSNIKNSDITIITGSAGIGKTKLALEVCNSFAEKNNFQFKVILHRGVDIFDDIMAYFNDERSSYLILIDDVNRIKNALEYIQEYYGEKFEKNQLKIVATVRDYAKEKVLSLIPQKLNLSEFELKTLNDDSIKTIIKNEYNITNPIYVERIIDISCGNPRLAIMAASIANEKNSLESIYDVTSLYDEYFSKIKEEIELFNQEEILLSIAIVSFFRVIDKSNDTQVELIENAFNISINDLWKHIEELHHLEIFDLYENEVVKVSDQILSTYLFYKIVFVDKKIPINIFLENFFPQYKTKFVDVLNPLLNTFDTQYILSVLKEPINQLWDKYLEDEQNLHEVINSFWFLKQTDILAYFNEKITNIDNEEFNIDKVNFWNRPNSNQLNDNILEKLSIFKNDTIQTIQMAVELLLIYFEKRPSKIQQVIYIFTKNYGFQIDSYRYSYEKENILLNTIWSYCKDGKNELITKLFIQVCRDFLKVEFEANRMKGNQFIMQSFKLAETEKLKILRDNIFKYLNSLNKIDKYQKDILQLIKQYSQGRGFKYATSDVEKWDSENIIKFIQENLTPESYEEAKTVQKCLDTFDRFKIKYDGEIREKFTNPTYELEKKMTTDKFEIIRKDNKTIELNEAEKIKHNELSGLVKDFVLSNWIQLFKDSNKFYNKGKNRDNYKFENNLRELFNILSKKDETLYIQVIKEYIKLGNPFNISLNLSDIINILGKEESYKLLKTPSYNLKDSWLFSFFQYLPEVLVDKSDIEEILELYKTVEKNSIPYNLEYIKKYLTFESDIFIQITKILINRTINENKNFTINIDVIFNSHSKVFPKIIPNILKSKRFGKNLSYS